MMEWRAVQDVLSRLLGIALVLLASVVILSGKASAVSQSEYWAFWDKNNEADFRKIDHSQWDDILASYVIFNHPSGINRFRYGDVSDENKEKLKRYLDYLIAQDPRTYCRLEQKAYWINLYNSLVVQVILDHFPVDSINDIKTDEDGLDIWGRKLVTIASTRLSLNDIEHRILRPLWKDYRLHFLLSCGALSCPNLQPKAFTSLNIQSMLSDAAREYINHPRGVQLEDGHLRASKIFFWYRNDFAGDNKHLIKVMAHYLDDRKALYLLGFQGEIEYSYDWRINSPET